MDPQRACAFVCLTRGLRFWELPLAVQNFGARAIKPYGVIPALHDWQAIGDLAIAATEVDGDRAVVAPLGRQVIERVGVVWVLLVVTLCVIHAHRPEAVDRHVPDVELVDSRAVISCRGDVEGCRILVGIAAPAYGCSDQVSYRINLCLRVVYGKGSYTLMKDKIGTRYVAAAVRWLIRPIRRT